jgi:hypothetical protein
MVAAAVEGGEKRLGFGEVLEWIKKEEEGAWWCAVTSTS